MNKGLLAIISILILVTLVSYVPWTEAQRLEKDCQKFGRHYASDSENKYLTDGMDIAFSYSKRLDTCIMTSVDELGVEYAIHDIKQNYLKDISYLFTCQKDGVGNVILSQAEKYKGYLFTVSFSEFLDNAEGGPSKAESTPGTPYTRDRCRALFEKKLNEIK